MAKLSNEGIKKLDDFFAFTKKNKKFTTKNGKQGGEVLDTQETPILLTYLMKQGK